MDGIEARDDGTTEVSPGVRRAKCDSRVAAIGDVEEAAAAIACVRFGEEALGRRLAPVLREIVLDLHDVRHDLANPWRAGAGEREASMEIATTTLDEVIAEFGRDLPALRDVTPTGTREGAALFLARAVTRRAERSVVLLMCEEGVDADAPRYLDRLGEALRVLARFVNARHGAEETWRPRRERRTR